MIAGKREIGKSACELCWEFFAPGAPLPEAVRLLGRYDVWDEKNPEWARIEAFQFGLRTQYGIYDPENQMWPRLLEPFHAHEALAEHIFVCGNTILSYRDQEAKALCADGCREETIYTQDFVPVRADGGAIRPHRLVCLNTLQRGSWLFKSVWDPEKHDMMCAYGRLKDGRWRVSLYSTKPEVDCGSIAKSLGGGGHKGASGFICEKLPWEGA